MREIYAIVRANSGLIVGDAGVGGLMVRGLADPDSLSPAESLRFAFLMTSHVNNAELGFHERELDVIDDWEMFRAVDSRAFSPWHPTQLQQACTH